MIPTLRKSDQSPRWRRIGRKTLEAGQEAGDRARATAEGLVHAGRAERRRSRRPRLVRLALVPVALAAAALVAGIARSRRSSPDNGAPAEAGPETATPPEAANTASNGAADARRAGTTAG